jgi:hypothetical protein
MHERYLSLADIFAVLYALHKPRCWPAAVLIVGASLLAYLPYLSSTLPQIEPSIVDLRIVSLIVAAAVLLLMGWFRASMSLFGPRRFAAIHAVIKT